MSATVTRCVMHDKGAVMVTDTKPTPIQHEPPMTVDYWRSTGLGGTLLLEYEIERKGAYSRSRRADGVIVLGAETKIVSRGPVPALHAEGVEIIGKKPWPSLDGEDVRVIQTKACPAGLPLLGQALLSPGLIQQLWKPRSLRSVAVHTGGSDPAILALLGQFHIESHEVPPANGHVDPTYAHLGRAALDWIHRRLEGEMVLGA